MSNGKNVNKVFWIILLAGMLGGSIPTISKIALEVFKPFTLVMIRFLSACLFLLPFIVKSKELSLNKFKQLFLTALFGALNPILFIIGLQFTKAQLAIMIFAGVPAMTVLYLTVFKKEKIKIEKIVGVIVGFLGVSIVVLLPLLEQGKANLSAWSNGLIFIASMMFLVYGLMSKEKQRKLKVTPLALTFYFSLVAFIISIPFSIYELNVYNLVNIGVKHILSILYLGIIGTGIMYLIYQYALKLSSELTANLFIYLQSIFGVLLPFFVLGEKITLPFIIGGSLALIGAKIAGEK